MYNFKPSSKYRTAAPLGSFNPLSPNAPKLMGFDTSQIRPDSPVNRIIPQGAGVGVAEHPDNSWLPSASLQKLYDSHTPQIFPRPRMPVDPSTPDNPVRTSFIEEGVASEEMLCKNCVYYSPEL